MNSRRARQDFDRRVRELRRSGPRAAPVAGEPAADVLFGLYLAARQAPGVAEALDLADRADGPLSAAARALDRTADLLLADPVLLASNRAEVRDLAARSLRQQAQAALLAVAGDET